MEPRDLTYADRFFASARLIRALIRLINNVPDGLHSKEDWIAPLKPVKEEHIFVGSGATGVLDALFWAICDPGDGVLLSVPYYVRTFTVDDDLWKQLTKSSFSLIG